MKHAAISIFAFIGSVASQVCGPATDCANWECHAPNNGDSWCKCFDTADENTYAATTGCDNGDGIDCACGPAAPQCAIPDGLGSPSCGTQGANTCPTATAPTPWCDNNAASWCNVEHCDQCAYGFGIVYDGCTADPLSTKAAPLPGFQDTANSCQPCGQKSRGKCQPGILPNALDGTPRTCHWRHTNNQGVVGDRLSLRANIGCGANLCQPCGVLNSQPCKNGGGPTGDERICDVGFAPRKWHANPNCVAQDPSCHTAIDWVDANAYPNAWLAPADGSTDCVTLPEVDGVFYNRVSGTYNTPDINNPHVHGPAWVF